MIDIYQQWIDAKEAEREAVDKRRLIEDRLIADLHIAEAEGSKTIKDGEYRVKVTQRFNRTIDAELLQEIAAEHGTTAHLAALFRWKPEINAKAWSNAGDNITGPLMQAITTKPGRPSFAIDRDNQE